MFNVEHSKMFNVQKFSMFDVQKSQWASFSFTSLVSFCKRDGERENFAADLNSKICHSHQPNPSLSLAALPIKVGSGVRGPASTR